MENKRILMLSPSFFGYHKYIADAIRERGCEVDLYDERLDNGFVAKVCLRYNVKAYRPVVRRYFEEIIRANKHKVYDYILVVKGEGVNEEVIGLFREAYPNAKFILYLWDSVSNIPDCEKRMKMYDRVLTFDRMDARKYNIVFLPLFFGKSYQKLVQRSDLTHNLCFIGTIHSDRQKIIGMLEADPAVTTGEKDFFCYGYLQGWFMYWYFFLRRGEFRKKRPKDFQYTQMPADEVAEHMARSVAILDIEHPKQTGLTMRTIETIGMGKKMVTTNLDIANYDFYNSNNILIIDRNNPKIEPTFFQTPYEPLPEELYKKYSINGWIDAVFSV